MLTIGVQTKGIIPEMSLEKGFGMIAKAGFTHVDLNLDTFLLNSDVYAGRINRFFSNELGDLVALFQQFRDAMEHYGIKASQMHAPYPIHVWGGNVENNTYMQGEVIPKSIVIAETLDVPWLVVHPMKLQYVLGREEERRRNLEYFKMLIPMLKNTRVGICFEDLYEGVGTRIVDGVCSDPDDAIWYIDTLNELAGEERFGMCLDTGHLQLTKRDPYTYIKKLGHRLKCVHLHENDGKADSHELPFSYGSAEADGLDWQGMIRGLREIGYDGTLSFETFPAVRSFPISMREAVLDAIYDVGEYLAEEIGEPEPKLRLGVIGSGRIAHRFVEAAKLVTEVGISCVYNPNQESAQRFATELGIETACSELKDLWDQVDAVYIASPHETHYKYAKEAILAGKHVLCEKPMAFLRAHAEDLYAEAERAHVVLFEGIKTAYCDGFIAMMELAQSGKIGQIRDVEACFTKLTPTNVREMTDRAFGGSMTELGSYVLLPMLKLLGTDAKTVDFQSAATANGVDAFTKLSLGYSQGMAMGKVGLGVKSEGELIISGTKGYIYAKAPWWLTKEFEVRYEDPAKRDVYTFAYEGSGLQYELRAFVQAIQGQAYKGGVTREESIAAASVMEAFLRNRPIPETTEEPVKIWAHRGCSMAYPENTLAAFAAAAKLPGLTGIELDVQFSRDGEIVVFHDENVARVTDGTKQVQEYTLEELKALHIEVNGIRSEEKIPTLEEVFELLAPACKRQGLLINIEFKTSVIHYEGIEERTLELVRKYGLEPYIVYSSFWAESVKKIKELDPTARTGMLAGSLSDCIRWGEYAHVDDLHPWVGGLDVAISDDWRASSVRAYNGEEPFWNDGRILKETQLEKYAAFGVTDVFTNVPEIYLLPDTVRQQSAVSHRDMYQVVFMPYNAAMWDSMASVWEACMADPACECLVVPLPYYSYCAENESWKPCYDGDKFPENVKITHFASYRIDQERPDLVYIHNPFDDCNHVTMIHPDYFSSELKKYAGRLVYIPYYVTSGFVSDMYLELPAYYYVDDIIIQSKACKEVFREYPYYDKILPLGSPKLDHVIQACREGGVMPLEWKELLAGRKCLMLNTSIGCFLDQGEMLLKKIRVVFDAVKADSRISVIWRPHPLLMATITSMRPQLMNEYCELQDYFVQEKIGVLDQTSDVANTVALADAYIGEESTSVINLFCVAGKPLLILDNSLTEEEPAGAVEEAHTHAFCCRESRLYTFEQFVDDLVEDRLQQVVERELAYVQNMAENADGTCGQKIHDCMMEKLRGVDRQAVDRKE